MASKWGEKSPTVDTGTIDDLSHLDLPLPRRFPVNRSIPECVYVCLQPSALNVQTQPWLWVGGGGGEGLCPHVGPSACACLGS